MHNKLYISMLYNLSQYRLSDGCFNISQTPWGNLLEGDTIIRGQGRYG